jgi:hypothetical protein
MRIIDNPMGKFVMSCHLFQTSPAFVLKPYSMASGTSTPSMPVVVGGIDSAEVAPTSDSVSDRFEFKDLAKRTD